MNDQVLIVGLVVILIIVLFWDDIFGPCDSYERFYMVNGEEMNCTPVTPSGGGSSESGGSEESCMIISPSDPHYANYKWLMDNYTKDTYKKYCLDQHHTAQDIQQYLHCIEKIAPCVPNYPGYCTNFTNCSGGGSETGGGNVPSTSGPKAPPYWIIMDGGKYRDMTTASWNSSKGGGLFRGGPMGQCGNQAKLTKENGYIRINAEHGCSAKSTQDDTSFRFNPPRNSGDPTLEIEFWTMMQLPEGKDENWGLKNIWASVWFEGSGSWPVSGELDAIEWCCPGKPEANIHNGATGAGRNIKGWTQSNNGWPSYIYNKLIHVYVVWEHDKISIYAGTETQKKSEMPLVATMDNWKTSENDNGQTNWFTGWTTVMDVKRYDSVGYTPGLNLWAAIRTRGGS